MMLYCPTGNMLFFFQNSKAARSGRSAKSIGIQKPECQSKLCNIAIHPSQCDRSNCDKVNFSSLEIRGCCYLF